MKTSSDSVSAWRAYRDSILSLGLKIAASAGVPPSDQGISRFWLPSALELYRLSLLKTYLGSGAPAPNSDSGQPSWRI